MRNKNGKKESNNIILNPNETKFEINHRENKMKSQRNE